MNKYFERCDKKEDKLYLSVSKMITWKLLKEEVM